MSDEKDEAEEVGAEGEEQGKGKKKLILLIIVAVVFLAIIGVGGYFAYAYFTKSGPFKIEIPTTEQLQEVTKDRKEQMMHATEDLIIRFPSSFTFNVMEEGSDRTHIVQIELALLVLGTENEALAKKHLSLLTAEVSQVLGTLTFNDLLAQTGRQRLKYVVLESLRARMLATVHQPIVDQVLITNFVMQ